MKAEKKVWSPNNLDRMHPSSFFFILHPCPNVVG
jgi:hypothetical protein